MNGRWIGCLAVAAGILGCTTHWVEDQNDAVFLYLKNPQAEEVLLACSLDGFARRPARRNQNGMWEVAVETKTEFRYFYLIDDKPYVPDCRFTEMDGWGGKNCIYIP